MTSYVKNLVLGLGWLAVIAVSFLSVAPLKEQIDALDQKVSSLEPPEGSLASLTPEEIIISIPTQDGNVQKVTLSQALLDTNYNISTVARKVEELCKTTP